MAGLQQRLRALSPETLKHIRRGIEKESLRVEANGKLALTPHPVALGSALTHPHVTTDFSEAQLELITGVHESIDACFDELTEIHQVVCRAIGDEMLWAGSMPCHLPTDETIPLGIYGSSNVGRAKSVYRMGLGHRYGRRMQMISGIHYNWSMPGVSTEAYFGLIRNFRRHSFLLLYLFGASPAVCASFVAGRQHELQSLNRHTLYMPWGTSLRMGRLGYQSDAQAALAVSYNNLESYAASLQEALTRPYPSYTAVGIRNPGGDYNQLSTSLLQIENEFYGTIRPKRVIFPGERPLHALRQRGVEYVEVRCLDLNPFVHVGIDAQTVRFIDLLLLHCLLSDSPPDTPQEIAALGRNQHLVAAQGRDPDLMLDRGGKAVALTEWGIEVLDECAAIAVALDGVHGGSAYREALDSAFAAMREACEVPSARVLAAMTSNFDNSYVDFTRAQSELARSALSRLPLPADREAYFQGMAQQSFEEQKRIEAADTMPFEAFRQAYLSPSSLGDGSHGS
ncbi:MAG: glutamate--cysteine ligase [Sulfuritalea sp.]|nr:glutamate--cysteine ligase [Sulfuritalea sp.]